MKIVQILLLNLVLSASLAFIMPSTAEAVWRAYQDGDSWGIREGGNKIPLGVDKKTAEKTAKKINKAVKKGVVADDSGPCADPTSGVLC